ncbi:sensor histidine kinase [Sciscionella sediminilitoris]|uniref:sensor histidine kinase n=1 Tax=Sciscionella sediminilitoris TaxID=1445613 RepID=UPI00068CF260|nr:sensor histidine kinase [Sciscionella sp. SE31]
MPRQEKDVYEYRPDQWPDWSLQHDAEVNSRRFLVGRRIGVWLWIPFGYVMGKDIAVEYPASVAVPAYIALTALLALYGLAGTWGLYRSHRARVQLVVAMYALGALPAVFTGSPDNLMYLIYPVVISIMLWPVRYSRLLAVGTVAGMLAVMYFSSEGIQWGEIGAMLGLGFGMSGFMMLSFTIGRLRAARGEIRELAVAEERERLARDLHDILGHSLTTITVKAGLARRMLEREEGGEGEHQATAEVRDVEELARQALADIRATVSNYRTASLPAEIAGARMSLQAAQITPDLPHAVDDVDPKLQEVFGYVVREAVTNVIRHSRADRCEVRLGRRWVRITDNGKEGAEQNGAGDGNGLRGLRERLAAVGGELTTTRATDGFQVLASVPAAAELEETG